MKIGITTFHSAHNYDGAVLQAYGLKEFLKLSGHSVNVVNYRPRIYGSHSETNKNKELVCF